MRFIESGPSIPDELLIARDEGRVVFFCGAGVSMARARLPNFFNLAKKVIQKLGVPVDDPVNKILIEAERIQDRTGIAGLISVDRVFGLLERDFEISDIESAVAEVLKPVFGIDLSAHHILLDLATTADNKVRLVTTNFDRLFEDCNRNLKVWHPPGLPDPLRPNEMDGVIYLHGCTNKDYSDSDGDGFILSSSDFGRAYLSEGWATTFFKNILDGYIVVFIGYSADDPPIQYLLEALNKKASQLSGVYAFQSGVTDAAAARWRHKGVEAITYSDANNSHCALWNTLEAWSVRAKDPEKWHQSIMNLARSRPESLQPYERGQVGHIISTLEGARRFSESDPSPPAEWLCVFDPYRRYAKPGYIGRLGSQRQFVDPFDLYGLDLDITPNKYDPDDYSAKREVPADAWDAFIANRLDHQNLSENNLAAIHGHWAINAAVLPPRMYQIGAWISKVANQSASIWWAANRAGLHPDIQQKIKYQINDSKNDTSLAIRKSWRYLFESWEHKIYDYQQDWYDLVDIINKEGWDNSIVRKFAAIHRAYLSIKQSFWNNPIPPLENKNAEINELLNLEIHYPEIPNDANIPNEWLSPIVCELRKNLEYALQLETELGSIGLSIVNPIIPYEKPNEDNYERTHGLSGTVIFFAHLFERLIEIDSDTAHQEFVAWPTTDDTIFSRLRIWACGKSGLTSPQIVGQIVMGLNDTAFWDIYHQRDFLLVLAKRWHELQPDTHKEIEKRLLKGPTKYDIEEDDNEFEERRAQQTLNRITWLKNNNCDFSFNLEIESNELRQIATNWKPECAMKAAESLVGGSVGYVRTDTEHSLLLYEPLDSILSKTLELNERTDDFLVEKNPFSGLSKQRPTLAFRALSHAARAMNTPNGHGRHF
ncbi:SIR2 family protein [Nitrosomonas sp. Is79A3]|uniref:SIR2 family protein n=1 Tax=Nitrosomonas sp. (strain Is79A3) TaxID=261292 RepID=UPI0002FED13B